jgi:hypothetical protein
MSNTDGTYPVGVDVFDLPPRVLPLMVNHGLPIAYPMTPTSGAGDTLWLCLSCQSKLHSTMTGYS